MIIETVGNPQWGEKDPIYKDRFNDDVKKEVDMNLMEEFGTLLSQLVEIPMSLQMHSFIEGLPQASVETVYLNRKEFRDDRVKRRKDLFNV
ncbi:hypothetical protein AC249_AIPGENE28069 [Exaiptasia diaphana]|nr:hypothetical protein AC249_AIPGENE28069 [Exaiptasia diaphana]